MLIISVLSWRGAGTVGQRDHWSQFSPTFKWDIDWVDVAGTFFADPTFFKPLFTPIIFARLSLGHTHTPHLSLAAFGFTVALVSFWFRPSHCPPLLRHCPCLSGCPAHLVAVCWHVTQKIDELYLLDLAGLLIFKIFFSFPFPPSISPFLLLFKWNKMKYFNMWMVYLEDRGKHLILLYILINFDMTVRSCYFEM